MASRANLALLLTALLLLDTLHCANWQGTGRGLNNTVMTEIWKDLELNLDNAAKSNDDATITALTKDISDRLNDKWDKAWNVVLLFTMPSLDSVFYGYTFRDQWMWYNGVPFASQSYNSAASLMVWKDYNCQTWKSIRTPNSESSLTFPQRNTIDNLVTYIAAQTVRNDVWSVALQLSNSLLAISDFSADAYSIVVTQDSDSSFYGYVCMKDSNFYYALGIAAGRLFMFQTR